jgi:hypothetical protein
MENEIPSIVTAIEAIDFDSYDEKDLLQLQSELAKKVANLESENTMFENFLGRVVPTKEEEFNQQDPEQNTKEMKRDKKKKSEKQKDMDRPVLLSAEQKNEIAVREVEELRDEIQRNVENWAKIVDNYKAEMEEVEIRMVEIKKEMYEFKRDIEIQALDKRTGKVMAERVVRYFEDKIRAKETMIEKIRLKNVTLKVQKNKLHAQLKQKEEMGEVLHAIDFDQLQIENKQYLQKIEERNQELLKLKMTSGNTMQILSFYKVVRNNQKQLQTVTQQFEKVEMEIAQRKELLYKLKVEEQSVLEEKAKAEKRKKWIVHQMDSYRVPKVMDYVLIKASQHDLQKKLKGWTRKVEISSMQTKRYFF